MAPGCAAQPPPGAITAGSPASAVSTSLRSISRNAASPFSAKIIAIGRPSRRSTIAPMSTNAACSFSATTRPPALLPDPGRPLRLEAEPQLHPLYRRDGHEGLRQPPVQLRVPRDVGAEPDGNAQRDHLDHAAQRVARGLGRVDAGDDFLLCLGVEAAHGTGIG